MESQGPETWLALFRLVYVFQVPREEEGVLKRSQLVDLTDSYATRSGPGLGKIICAWLAHNLLQGGSTSRMRVSRLSVGQRRLRRDHTGPGVSRVTPAVGLGHPSSSCLIAH